MEGKDFSATETQEPEANSRDIASLEQNPNNDEEPEDNSRDMTLLEPSLDNVDELEANLGCIVLLEGEPGDFEIAPIFEKIKHLRKWLRDSKKIHRKEMESKFI